MREVWVFSVYAAEIFRCVLPGSISLTWLADMKVWLTWLSFLSLSIKGLHLYTVWKKPVLTLVQIGLSSENTNIYLGLSWITHSCFPNSFPPTCSQWVLNFRCPRAGLLHVLLLELLSLSSLSLLCLNLWASGTVLACEHFEMDCCRNFGEAFCVLWNWNPGCFLHGSAHSSSPALFLSFLSPLLLHSQSCALYFLWSQPGRWEIQHLSRLSCTSVLQYGELNMCLFSLWGAQVGGCNHCTKQLTELLPNLEPLQTESVASEFVAGWEFLLRSMNSQVRLLIPRSGYVRDAWSYPYSWIKA